MEEERCREVRGVNSWSNCRISYVNVHIVRCAGSEVAGVRGCASPTDLSATDLLDWTVYLFENTVVSKAAASTTARRTQQR